MSLPVEFVASATGLECYLACPRRFRHRYIDRLPAAGTIEDTAGRIRRGDLFHKLVVWDSLGMDIESVLAVENDEQLADLWQSFARFQDVLYADGSTVQHEQVLTARCNGIAVTARLDALVTAPDGTITIYDWKTGSGDSSHRLVNHPQSQVYPWVVQQLRQPPALHLVYWLPDKPDSPLHIACTPGYLRDAGEWLTNQLATIAADQEFPLTTNRRICRTCSYLAHCGVRATNEGDDFYLDEDFYTPDPTGNDGFDDPEWMYR